MKLIALVVITAIFAWLTRNPVRRRYAPPTNGERLSTYRMRLDDAIGLDSEAHLQREARGAQVKAILLARFREEIPRSHAMIVPRGSKVRLRYTGPQRRMPSPAAEPSPQCVLPFRVPRKRRAA